MIVAVVLGGSFLISKCRRWFSSFRIHLAFAICWLPIQIILVLKSLDLYHQTTMMVGIQIGSHVLAYSSSCVNPLLYAFLSENFRKAFHKVSWIDFYWYWWHDAIKSFHEFDLFVNVGCQMRLAAEFPNTNHDENCTFGKRAQQWYFVKFLI